MLVARQRADRFYLPGIIDIDGEERTHSTLRIGNVTEADQGDIWCVAQYDGGMHDSDKAKLTVVGKESAGGDFYLLLIVWHSKIWLPVLRSRIHDPYI